MPETDEKLRFLLGFGLLCGGQSGIINRYYCYWEEKELAHKYVYLLSEGNASLRALLGGKGIAKMVQGGLVLQPRGAGHVGGDG